MANQQLVKKVVTARAGLRVPMEDYARTRREIGAEPVEVELTAYYLRRLAEGDLVEHLAGVN